MKHCSALWLAAGLCAAPAFGQSSVVIYGTVDAGVQVVDDIGGRSRWSLGSGAMQPERFGLRGVEDMGNGLKADFRLETGILTKSGQQVVAERLFNREASLGLNGGFGSFRMGRMPDLMYEFIPKYLSPPALTAIVAKHPGNWDNYASQYQFGNSVMYTTPDFGGFKAAAQYGFGEVPGDSRRNRNLSVGATYTAGPWRTALVASEHRNRPVDIAGRMGVTQAFGVTLTPGVAVSTDSVRNVAIGTSWRGTSTIVGVAYSRTRMSALGGDATQHNVDIGGGWTYAPSQTVQATFTHSRFEGARWNQLKLVGIYGFSKRTSAYLLGQYQRAAGDAKFAAMQDIGVASGRSQTMLTAGIIHSF
ncbi:porin [Pigmentiphaga kullae]|uniref:Putative porin n=1 Tax=Pigmentiphaga kullae TaxID=151784 RepID=A0A4Q7NKA0_9BURK|nr:porin [Pigmentiphaga kullae]RZS85338.1 putative porin [Pigmentiphaga kullae]